MDLEAYAAKHKSEIRAERRALPVRDRVREYLLDWATAVHVVSGRRLFRRFRSSQLALRRISSDLAWALIKRFS